ncbi:MAG: hypothetical protein ACFFD4_12690 [Candidatus Odinarchaeota archaeon]
MVKQHYQDLLNDLGQVNTMANVPEEITRAITATEWIRIFLNGDVKTKQISMYIEISYPRSLRAGNNRNTGNSSNSGKNNHLRKILENQIVHLEYLIKLHDEGFALGFIGEEGTWFATKVLETEPSVELFDLVDPLIPVSTGSKGK